MTLGTNNVCCNLNIRKITMKHDTRAERAAKRRFAILTLLHTGPRSYEEIIIALREKGMLDDLSDFTDDTIRYQFRHDLQALRLSDCYIDFDRSLKKYSWCNSPFGLSLSSSQLLAFVTLLTTFED